MENQLIRSARFGAAGLLLGLLSLSSHASWSQSQPSLCSPPGVAGMPASSQKQVREFQQRVEAGPFYKKVLQQLGGPQSCNVKLDGDNIRLWYVFRDDARLDAQISSTIESSEQRASFRGLSGKEALALLKKGELDSFGRDGCGIDWNRPEDQAMGGPPGSRATVFRGDACNCQARIVYQGTSVVALVLRSAC